MRIAIFGSGGVGGYFGGLLANAGHDVTFIARGEHLKAIQENGLYIKSINGDFHIKPAQASDDPTEVGHVDYVVVGVKHYHLDEAVNQIVPLVSGDTTVVPLLNGVDAHDILKQKIGPQTIVGGLCSLVSMVQSPGVIFQPSKLRRVVVGELNRTKSERVEKIVQAWAECGAEAIHADDIFVSMWTKFLFIASFGGITSLAQVNAGELMAFDETRQLYVEAMQEVKALADVQGINLKPDAVEAALNLTRSFEPSATSSMQRDVAAGNPFELEAFSGKIKQLGEALGVNTPVHNTIYALLLPYLARSQAASS
jgi:2-dehydropantoate 2-reductase